MLKVLVVADIRENEVSLSDLWFFIQQKKKDTVMPYKERKELPRALDYRVHISKEEL